MSEENLEVIRAAHAAVNRRDLDALLALAHPEVEFRSLIAEAEGRDYRGHAGVREWWESVIQSLGGMHSVIEHTEAFEDGAISRVRLSGEVEGVGLSQTVWEAFRIRDGVLVWWCFYRTEAEALEAVGLREESMSQENVEARNEVVRRFVAAFESDTDAFRDTLHLG